MKVRFSHPYGLSHPDGAPGYAEVNTLAELAEAVRQFASAANLTPNAVRVRLDGIGVRNPED